MYKKIQSTFYKSIEITKLISDNSFITNELEVCIKKIIFALKNKKKVLFSGNGGSAADCQHMAGEFISKFMKDRKSIAAIALTTDTSIITSISNDYGYEYIFSRQLEGIAEKGDIAFAYSTSGNSQNVINGLKKASEMGLTNIGLTGLDGGEMKKYCKNIIKVPSNVVPRIQEVHLLIGHIICEVVEEEMTKNE